MQPSSHSKTYTLYGRRKGRPLRVTKQGLMDNLLPRIALPEGSEPLDLQKIFLNKKDVCLEVGFGGGEHLAAQAAAHPDYGFIGCEPFMNGIASLLSHIDEKKLQNIRLWPHDARPLLDRLPKASLSRVFVLFPDPWPKKRHAGRRFIGPDNLEKLARVIKPGGELRMASDDPTMQAWMQEQLSACLDFTPAPGVMQTRPEGWPPTRYEEKALKAKRTPLYFSFRRGS
ncbi:MAG TPA: tRNA (guanosine(46)-N7)-methyltransferase TrmB [Alphaproteobacteria bacterium]|nr:tRNA (guanosine(46)-N7)-methyltransferase TrmB [Alphaproteobacteria bacterium]